MFVSCEDAVDPPATYVVTFDKQYGTDGSDTVTATVDAAMPTATAPTRDGYDFKGYNALESGDGKQYYNASMESITNWDKTVATTLYARWEANLGVGDTGPAGGKIFYKKSSYDIEWNYLEAAPSDIEYMKEGVLTTGHIFGYYRTSDTGDNLTVFTEASVGTGKANTEALVAAMESTAYKADKGSDTTATYAAKLCSDHVVGEYSDWFLPSSDELNLMYQNLRLNNLGGFTDSHYWSSLEAVNMAKGQYFNTDGVGAGVQSYDFRSVGGKSRPIRAF